MQPHVTRQHVTARERTLAHVALVALDHFTGAGAVALLLRFVARGKMFDQTVVHVEALTALLAAESRCRVADQRRRRRLGRTVIGRHVAAWILGRQVLR